jgi:acetyltransferase-like isoleucine patch superfamily enzyme
MVAGISRILARWRLNRQRLGGMGTNVVICPGYQFDKPENIRIGSHVHIGPGAWISAIGGVTIEDGVIMGPRVRIYTANHRCTFIGMSGWAATC